MMWLGSSGEGEGFLLGEGAGPLLGWLLDIWIGRLRSLKDAPKHAPSGSRDERIIERR